MKKTLPIFLFICLATPFLGAFALLQYTKSQIKRDVKQKLLSGVGREELVLLRFSRAESNKKLQWEHASEFEFEGEMYDVVDQQVSEDSVFYWCWWDHQETKLNQQLKALVADATGKSPLKQEKQKRLVEMIKTLYFSKTAASQSINPAPPCQIHSTVYLMNYRSVSLSIPAPPPKKTLSSS